MALALYLSCYNTALSLSSRMMKSDFSYSSRYATKFLMFVLFRSCLSRVLLEMEKGDKLGFGRDDTDEVKMLNSRQSGRGIKK